jgi:hypothetical protein
MIQRDYIERLIEQCAEVLRQALRLRRSGQLEPALQMLRDAEDQVLGPLRPLVEQLEASSAVQVAGPSQVERLRLYASLIGEEAVIQRARGDAASAFLAGKRALELYGPSRWPASRRSRTTGSGSGCSRGWWTRASSTPPTETSSGASRADPGARHGRGS